MNNPEEDLGSLANFLFEVGMLAQSPRSFTSFLGSGRQSIAEHINRTTYVGLVLAMMEKDVDASKVILMCLLHDLAEARTSDLNYVHQKYVESDEEKVIQELAASLPFGDRILEVLGEFKGRETVESRLAKDADQIEFILTLKEQIDIGNVRAQTWLPASLKRLKTDAGKRLAAQIVATPSDEWWFSDKDSQWWVDRPGGAAEKRF
jgi:putative hydrolase of HD superfamily